MKNRISTKRLRAAITQVNNARKHGIGLPKWPGPCPHNGTVEERDAWSAAFELAISTQRAITAERATLLYSLRSHLRNRLHITHQYIQKPVPGTPGHVVEVCEPRNMTHQAALVEPLMEEFEMTDEEAALDAELRAKRIAACGGAWDGQQDPLTFNP